MEKQFTILIAGDDPASLFRYQDGLKETGLDSLIAGNGLQVINTLEHEKVDLLLTDLGRMPEVTEVELISYVCGTYPGLPVVVVSGHGRNIANNLAVRGQKVRASIDRPARVPDVISAICAILRVEEDRRYPWGRTA